MCLLLAIFVLLGPRALIFFWWLVEPQRWSVTFQSAFVPVIGLLFLPWTTIIYVLVWLWLGIGLAVDIASYGSSEWGNRNSDTTPPTWTSYDGV